jgi:hypothetical protein
MIQTDNMSCINCNSELKLESPGRKIYKKNDYKESLQSNEKI